MAIDRDRYERSQRYEIILDNGEDARKWSSLSDNTGTIVSGTAHVTGAQSISFDKISGSWEDAYIVRPISQMRGSDLDPFSSEGQILSSVYFPSLTDVSSYNVALLMASGTEHGAYYSVADTDLSVGWNHIKMDCNSYTTVSGHGVNWKEVKWVAAGVSFDSASDTLAGILVDSLRLQVPTSTYKFDPNIDNITITAGTEIAIKNGDAADELSVDHADTARTTSTNVIPVQVLDSTAKVSPAGEINSNSPFSKITDGSDDLDLLRVDASTTVATIAVPTLEVDSTGKVSPAGEVATNAPFVALTDGINTATIDSADTARTPSTIVQVTQPVDASGNVISGGGGTSGGLTLYSSPVHFTATYNTVSGIDLTGMSFTVSDFSQFVDIKAWDASRGFIEKYTPETHTFDWDSANDCVLVGDAAFVTGGTFKVSILAEDRTISTPLDAAKSVVLNPINENYSFEEVADITNETDASTDYYVDLSGYTHCVIQYKVVGGIDTLGLSVHGTIQGDAAAASCEYMDITANGMDNLVHTTTSGIYDFDTTLKMSEGSSWKYLKINVASSLGSSDGDYKIWAHKWY